MMNKIDSSEDENDSSDEDNNSKAVFAAWRMCKNESISSDMIGKSYYVNAIEIYGSSNCLLSYGKTIQKEDTDKCVIGNNLAEKIFGSHDVEGQKLIYNGRELFVWDVVDEPSNLFLTEVSDINDIKDFNRINLLCGNQSDTKRIGQSFIDSNGLPTDIVHWDYFNGLAWIKEMIPGKWSDLDGWKENANKIAKYFSRMNTIEKSDIESIYMKMVIRAYIWFGIGAVLLIISIISTFSIFEKHKKSNHGLGVLTPKP